MGMSVFSQCDKNKYFALSTIERKVMNEYGITCTIKELQDRARSTPPAFELITGRRTNTAMRRKTKIYKYEDFITEKKNESTGNLEGADGQVSLEPI